jgi:hypothetical protein
MATFITSSPSWVLFILTLCIGLASAEAGVLLVKRREKKGIKDKEGPVGSLMGALLALLAFMLGFTFSITASRYSERKHLVVDQAKAIGTCYLRTSLIPEKQKLETRKLLNQYINLLVDAANAPVIEKNNARIEALQIEIWKQTASLKDEDMDSPLRSLYVSSVNQVIDVFGERKAVVLTFRIPSAIWAALLMLYIFCLFVVGLEVSSYKNRRSLNVPIMTAAFSLIVVLIAAMDASRKKGHFTVSQEPLIEIQEMIRENQSNLAGHYTF